MVDKHKNVCSGNRRTFDLRNFRDSSVYRDRTNRRLSVTGCGGDHSRTAADCRYFSVCDRRHGLIGTRPCDRFIRCIAGHNGRRKRFAFADFQCQRRFIERHGSYLDNFRGRFNDCNRTRCLLSVARRCSDCCYTTANSCYFPVYDRRHGLIGTCPCYRFIRRIARQDGRRKCFACANL